MTRLLIMVALAVPMVVASAACGGGGRAPAPTPADPARPHPSNDPVATTPSGDKGTTTSARGASVCTTMIDHLIDLDVAERPGDQQITPDQLTALRTQIHESYTPICQKQPRAVIDCALAATTLAAARACEH